MSLDVVDLRNFYTQQLGTLARRFIGHGIRARWSDTRGERVVGLGLGRVNLPPQIRRCCEDTKLLTVHGAKSHFHNIEV